MGGCKATLLESYWCVDFAHALCYLHDDNLHMKYRLRVLVQVHYPVGACRSKLSCEHVQFEGIHTEMQALLLPPVTVLVRLSIDGTGCVYLTHSGSHSGTTE